ncbi:recombinase family protein [Patescibacteria group bacterium]|nr:recombinase family protein [Patescibacteria group bacterium]
MKEKGIKNRGGKNFSKTNIAHILRNVVYIGKIKHINEIYQGIHEPIISEEIFSLAQKIHKEKLKNFRVYKNFLFGGLINCEECGSKMTSCFTNKRDNGKLKRYYYYRCTSTFQQDWQSCSVKQVSAERLENFVLENLEWISLDKNYLENLIFRLNHSSNPELKNSGIPHRAGYEPTKPCSKFSPEAISSALKFFLSTLSQKKGIEKNLWAKKFIEKILYSKEYIKFSLFYRENWENLAAENSPARREPGGASARSADWEDLIFSKNSQFVSYSMAPVVGFEPTTFSLHFTLKLLLGVDYIFAISFIRFRRLGI